MSEEPKPSPQPQGFDWDAVVNQIFEMIGTNNAIIDTYGMLLASRIQGFEKGRLISPIIWDLIQNREKVTKELGMQQINSLVLETEKGNIVITFGMHIYLMSIIPPSVDLSQYMPSLSRFISTLDKTTDKSLGVEMQKIILEEEYNELLIHEKNKDTREDSFPIFKDLIKFIAK